MKRLPEILPAISMKAPANKEAKKEGTKEPAKADAKEPEKKDGKAETEKSVPLASSK